MRFVKAGPIWLVDFFVRILSVIFLNRFVMWYAPNPVHPIHIHERDLYSFDCMCCYRWTSLESLAKIVSQDNAALGEDRERVVSAACDIPYYRVLWQQHLQLMFLPAVLRVCFQGVYCLLLLGGVAITAQAAQILYLRRQRLPSKPSTIYVTALTRTDPALHRTSAESLSFLPGSAAVCPASSWC